MTKRHSLYNIANRATPTDQPIPAIPTPAERFRAVTAAIGENKPHRKDHLVTEPKTVEVVTLGLECGIDANVVAQRLGANVITDDASGIRVVPADCAKAFLAELASARQRERERQAQLAAEIAANNTALRTRERVRRLAAQQRTHGSADPGVPAFALMLSGTADDPLERSGSHMSEMLSNATSMAYHKITRED